MKGTPRTSIRNFQLPDMCDAVMVRIDDSDVEEFVHVIKCNTHRLGIYDNVGYSSLRPIHEHAREFTTVWKKSRVREKYVKATAMWWSWALHTSLYWMKFHHNHWATTAYGLASESDSMQWNSMKKKRVRRSLDSNDELINGRKVNDKMRAL